MSQADMDLSIYELLKVFSTEDCVKNCAFRPKNQLKKSLLQLYVQLMCRNPEELEASNVDAIDTKLIVKIFNSTIPNVQPSWNEVVKVSQFLQTLLTCFTESFIEIAQTSIRFLSAYSITLQSTNDYSVSLCCLLLVLHLDPIAKTFMRAYESENNEIAATSVGNESLQQKNKALLEMVTHVIQVSSIGMELNNAHCEMIIDELIICFEKYPKLFIIDHNLTNFYEILKTDYDYEGPVQLNIIEILLSILENLVISRDCVERVLFSEGDALVRLLEHRALNTDDEELFSSIVKVFIEMSKLPMIDENFKEHDRIAIYATRFKYINDPSDLELVIKMMEAYNDEQVSSLIKVFELLKSSDCLMENVIERVGLDQRKLSLDVFSLLQIQDVDVKFARRTGRLFKWLVETEAQQEEETLEIVSKFPETLNSWLRDEKVFGLVIEFFNFADGRPIMQLLNIMSVALLIPIFTEAFNRFQNALTLRKIITAFQVLARSVPKLLIDPLKKLFAANYTKLLAAEANEMVETSRTMSHDLFVLKLSMLVQSNLYAFLDYFKFEALIIINMRKLSNPNDSSFPLFARFYFVVLKEMWRYQVQQLSQSAKKDLPFTMAFVVDQVLELVGKLFTVMHRRDYNLLQARDVVTSLVGLMHEFYLHPIAVSERKVLLVNHPKVSANQIEVLAEFVKVYCFVVDPAVVGYPHESFYEVEFQKEILNRMAELVRKHSLLPNLKSLRKVIRYYRENGPLQRELENILIALIDRCAVTETLSLTIIDFSQHDDAFEFMAFFKALENFLAGFEQFEGKNLSRFKVSVAEEVVKLLDSAEKCLKEGIDVKKTLEFLRLFLKSDPAADTKKLKIPKELLALEKDEDIDFD